MTPAFNRFKFKLVPHLTYNQAYFTSRQYKIDENTDG